MESTVVNIVENRGLWCVKWQRWANSIKIKEHKARWGSCSYKNDISYNWRLIIAPQPVVDYVVVHELCHILEHNHSPRFWQHVGNIMPSFKEHRAWLKQNEGKLIF